MYNFIKYLVKNFFKFFGLDIKRHYPEINQKSFNQIYSEKLKRIENKPDDELDIDILFYGDHTCPYRLQYQYNHSPQKNLWQIH